MEEALPMVNAVYVFLAALAVAAPAFVLTPVVRAWWRARGGEGDALEVAFHEVFHMRMGEHGS